MDDPPVTSSPANDNRDLFERPEGAYFQVLKARRRHLRHDTSAMTPERYRQWQTTLDGLLEAERRLLPHLRRPRSEFPAAGLATRFEQVVRGTLAALLLVAGWLRPGAGSRRD